MCKKQLFTLLLVLPLLAVSCAVDEGEMDMGMCERCDVGDSDAGDTIVSCTNFNFECSGSLVCRPIDYFEASDQFCLPPFAGTGSKLNIDCVGAECGHCDDDDDCAGENVCLGETNLFSAGYCSSSFNQSQRCFDFNAECDADLTCRPVDYYEEDQFCLPPFVGTGSRFNVRCDGEECGHCDDSDDCAQGVCVDEDLFNAGYCIQL